MTTATNSSPLLITILLILIAQVASVITSTPATRALRPVKTPIFPDNISTFPKRDFVNLAGFSANVGKSALVEVYNSAGDLIGQAIGIGSATGSFLEVNHPGGVCWGTVVAPYTPNIMVGDTVMVTFDDDSYVSMRVPLAETNTYTIGTGPSANTITITGTLGPAVSRVNFDQSILNQDLVTEPTILKRVVTALPGPLVTTLPSVGSVGYASGIAITGNAFVATFVFADAAVAARVFATTPGSNGPAVDSWIPDANGNAQSLTIDEFDFLGGPFAPICPPYQLPLFPFAPSYAPIVNPFGFSTFAERSNRPVLLAVAPDSITSFVDRDFIVAEGFAAHAGEWVMFEVFQGGIGGKLTGQALGVTDGVVIEVNHPGGLCWGSYSELPWTPDIQAGDYVMLSFVDGTYVSQIVAGAKTTSFTLSDKTITVSGVFGPTDSLVNFESRILNPDILDEPSILRRDVRAAIGPLTETLAPKSTLGYSSGVTVSAAARTFVATYVFVDAGVAAHVFAITPGLDGARALSWAETDANANMRGLNIQELGLIGGPGFAGCPTYATVPPTATPTAAPTQAPSATPTTAAPSAKPTAAPTAAPSVSPSARPSARPSVAPATVFPTATPTVRPTTLLSAAPTVAVTVSPSATPTAAFTARPTAAVSASTLTATPTVATATVRTVRPTIARTVRPTASPTTCLAVGSTCIKSAMCCSGSCNSVCR